MPEDELRVRVAHATTFLRLLTTTRSLRRTATPARSRSVPTATSSVRRRRLRPSGRSSGRSTSPLQGQVPGRAVRRDPHRRRLQAAMAPCPRCRRQRTRSRLGLCASIRDRSGARGGLNDSGIPGHAIDRGPHRRQAVARPPPLIGVTGGACGDQALFGGDDL